MVLLQLLEWRLGQHQLFLLFHSLLRPEPEPASRAQSIGSSRQIVPCPGDPAAESSPEKTQQCFSRSFWRWVVMGEGLMSPKCASSSVGQKRGGGRDEGSLRYAELILPELCVVSA